MDLVRRARKRAFLDGRHAFTDLAPLLIADSGSFQFRYLYVGSWHAGMMLNVFYLQKFLASHILLILNLPNFFSNKPKRRLRFLTKGTVK